MRPDVDRYFFDMARLVSSRSTCIRRYVGCVLVDSKNRVLATGYNGTPSGAAHCNDVVRRRVHGKSIFSNSCPGATARSGTQLGQCLAVHAEQNAILQCANPDAIAKAYVTTFPCESCVKLLLNTGCREIVYDELYSDLTGWAIWAASGKLATHFDNEPSMIQRDIVLLYGLGDPLNPWRVVVACVCLNLCSARMARGVVMRILDRWPTPAKLSGARKRLDDLLKPLGLADRRAKNIRGISADWGTRRARDLPGVGPYALESIAVFCEGRAPKKICDRKVAAWVHWRTQRDLPLL